MDTINMNIVNGTVFQNNHCNSTDIENKIQNENYQLIYNKYKQFHDENLEKEKLPSMITPFYLHILCNGAVPGMIEYIEFYFFYYRGIIKENKEKHTVSISGHEFDKLSVIHRVLRAYPSLIRDYHFYCKLVESRKFGKVEYSISNDLNGRDINIEYNNKQYELSLYVDTNRSIVEKVKKNTNRHKYSDNEIQLPLNLSNAYEVGDFKLYGNAHIDRIINKIESRG